MRISDWSSDVCSSELLDFRLRAEPVLDRRRRDILALAGLEQFLDAAGHAPAAVGIDLAAVAGMEEAVVRGFLGGLLRPLEIADQDRYCVASGNGVSLRFNLVCRCMFKK